MRHGFFFCLLCGLAAACGLATACGGGEKSECRKDTDCKGDRVCERGRCAPPVVRPSPPAPDPDPDPDPLGAAPPPAPKTRPTLPSLPMLQMPNFQLGPGGLNLNFKLQVGADEHTIELDPSGSMSVKWCVNQQCDVLDLTRPADVERMLDRLANTAGSADPHLKETLQMLKDLSQMMNQGGGLPGLGGGSPGGPGPFTNLPSGPKRLTTFRSGAEIVAAGNQAEGAEALLSDLSPTIVSSDQVTFRTADGIGLDLSVPAALQSRLPALARSTGPQTARFRILRVTPKYIKGELRELPGP